MGAMGARRSGRAAAERGHRAEECHGLGRGSAATKAENRAVLDLVKFVNNDKLSNKQKVQALRKASTHHQSRLIFQSAGLIDNKEYDRMKHWFNQIQKMLQESTATDHAQGRAPDHKRALMRAALLLTQDTPTTAESEQDDVTPIRSGSKPPSKRKLFEALGINPST